MNFHDLLVRHPRKLPRRLWRRLLLGLDPHRSASFTLSDGSRFDCPLGAAAGRLLTLEALDVVEQAFVRQQVQPGDTVVDIGASLGLFTLIAARRAGPGGRVFAFEPSRREAAYLERNVRLNGLTNVSVIKAAVADAAGTAPLAIATDGGLNSLSANAHPEQHIEAWETVETITLDAFVAEHGVSRVHFVKLDVEGAEASVLDGAVQLLRGARPPVILCEFCDVTAAGRGGSGRQLYQKFEALGFRLFELRPEPSGGVRLRPAPAKARYDLENLAAVRADQPLPDPGDTAGLRRRLP
jgi:FkbM family methyltransferase